jgi:hypothetical protein
VSEQPAIAESAAAGAATQAGRSPAETRAKRGDGSAESTAEAGFGPLSLRSFKRGRRQIRYERAGRRATQDFDLGRDLYG